MAFTLQTKKNTNSNNRTEDNDEFAGLWINVGVQTPVDGAEKGEDGEYDQDDLKFVRIPRGIAISDMKNHRIYNSTNSDWAAEAALINSVMDAIREKAIVLEEGEAVPINLSVQLYRRQEQVESAAPSQPDKDVSAQLFS